MKCRTCGQAMIQKPWQRLLLVGILMVASIAIVKIFPAWWPIGIVLVLTGSYLIVWATLGRGGWCRTCKKFSLLPH